jgi:hypothetical protein
MYEESPNLIELRQGDILSGVYLPRFSLVDTHFLHTIKTDGTLKYSDMVMMKTATNFAAVISQCCEFNPGKRNSFSLAQVVGLGARRTLPRRSFSFNLAEIVTWKKFVKNRDNIDPWLKANTLDGERFQCVNVYVLRPDGKHFTDYQMIDFSRVFSVRMEEKEGVLSKKVLQLDAAHRIELQDKLAYFYSRQAEDGE